MRAGSLFSGYEGLGMAVNAHFGSETAWVSDVDPGACKILAHHLPDVPNLGDITTVDWSQVEPVDILHGGFPCQDLSHAGKRAGLRPDTRSGLWAHMAYAIKQLRPRYVIAENVRGILSAAAHSDLEPCPWCVGGAADGEPDLRALGAVLGDLAVLGYDAQWVGLRAADVGAPHGRFRVFIVAADSDRFGRERTRPARGRGQGPTDRGLAAADASGQRYGGREDPRAVGRLDGEDAGEARQRERPRPESGDRGSAAAADPHSDGPESVRRLDTVQRDVDRRSSANVAWGAYEPAIRRWESILGRPAPSPTELGAKDSPRLSPAFVEHMMGLPEGWVTNVPGLNRNAQLKALGNGVVPAQAFAALQMMLGVDHAEAV